MGEQLTIGELANRVGVATSTLRYWEDLGLLPPPARSAGQRRYSSATVGQVGVILLLRDAGFTLREINELVARRPPAGEPPVSGLREPYRRKLAELDERIAKAQVAREAIAHALACPHDDVFECPTFARILAARLEGASLQEAHECLSRVAIDGS
ncbi:MerR family transcriptional regulator [Nonomuraea terrae]|uniref:MerR family transcriptional regulator n=1 Tax=Nonomuraea terrae TaxID=2530383 RepID=UPI0037B61994